jgi:hypothetical protein
MTRIAGSLALQSMTRFRLAGAALVLALLSSSSLGCSRDSAALPPEPAAAATVAPNSYELEVSGWEGPVGEEGYVMVTITAKGDHHINSSYPQKVKLDAPEAGLALPARELRLADAQLENERRLTYTVPVTPERAGEYLLRGEVHLSVCNEDQCRIDKAPLSARVVAQ